MVIRRESKKWTQDDIKACAIFDYPRYSGTVGLMFISNHSITFTFGFQPYWLTAMLHGCILIIPN